MSVGNAILLVLVIAVVVAAATLVIRRMALRKQVGPEYDRLVREIGPRRAKSEYARRRQRVAGLGIKPLSAERRAGYDAQWMSVQERFIDSPLESVQAAAALVTAVAADRGYPVDDDSQLLTDLSVHHGSHLADYRRARRTTEQAELAATEQLRHALLEHRAMFRELVGQADDDAARPRLPGKLALARSGR